MNNQNNSRKLNFMTFTMLYAAQYIFLYDHRPPKAGLEPSLHTPIEG